MFTFQESTSYLDKKRYMYGFMTFIINGQDIVGIR